MPTGSPLGHQVEGHPWCFFPNQCPWRCTWGNHKTKPAAVLDYNKYKTGVDRSDQMLSFYSQERNWWKKLILHLFNLVVFNAQFLHTKTCKKKMSEIFYERVTEGLLASASIEIQVHGQSSSPAGRLVGRDHSVYRIPLKQAKLEGKSQCSCRMCAERSKRQTGKTVKKSTTTYCWKSDVGLCIGQCFEVCHTKMNYWK
jgi:hypothetical protein